MYGKIFDSIYDGTLRADWKALVTFQQFIILANKDGIVDMTPHAISGRTGIPLDIIEPGIEYLSSPDKYSRSSEEDGRRIVPLDPTRNWGWRLVNHAYYNRLRSAEEKREADRERIRGKRAASSGWEGGPITGEKCAYCGIDATGVDHIIASDNGGPDHDSNLVPCCHRCNSSKHLRKLHDFLNDSTTAIDVDRVLSNEKLTKLVSYVNGRFVAVCRGLSPNVAEVAPVAVAVSVTKKTHTVANATLSEFEAFWKTYPKRNGSNPKKPASTLFASAVKRGVPPQTIIDGAARYAAASADLDRQYIAQAVTWLRQERWNDETKPVNRDHMGAR